MLSLIKESWFLKPVLYSTHWDIAYDETLKKLSLCEGVRTKMINTVLLWWWRALESWEVFVNYQGSPDHTSENYCPILSMLLSLNARWAQILPFSCFCKKKCKVAFKNGRAEFGIFAANKMGCICYIFESPWFHLHLIQLFHC